MKKQRSLSLSLNKITVSALTSKYSDIILGGDRPQPPPKPKTVVGQSCAGCWTNLDGCGK